MPLMLRFDAGRLCLDSRAEASVFPWTAMSFRAACLRSDTSSFHLCRVMFVKLIARPEASIKVHLGRRARNVTDVHDSVAVHGRLLRCFPRLSPLLLVILQKHIFNFIL